MTFKKYLTSILEEAGVAAQADRSTSIEAHHLLLAIAGQPDTLPGRVLHSVGLSQSAIREALDRELERSLRAAGIVIAAANLPRSTGAVRPTGLGASVRQALERGVARVVRKPQPAHLLLGILQAQNGTVPRALAIAGIDRGDLVSRVQQTLDDS